MKQQIMDCLARAGFIVWHLRSTRVDMYAMLLIACNRLSPSRPKAAMQMLNKSLASVRARYNADKDTPKCVEVEGREKVRAAALLIAQDGCCPVCDGKWNPEEYDPASPRLRQLINDRRESKDKLNLSQYPPQSVTIEANAPHCECGVARSQPQNDTTPQRCMCLSCVMTRQGGSNEA